MSNSLVEAGAEVRGSGAIAKFANCRNIVQLDTADTAVRCIYRVPASGYQLVHSYTNEDFTFAVWPIYQSAPSGLIRQ